jgi:hypothetical protein
MASCLCCRSTSSRVSRKATTVCAVFSRSRWLCLHPKSAFAFRRNCLPDGGPQFGLFRSCLCARVIHNFTDLMQRLVHKRIPPIRLRRRHLRSSVFHVVERQVAKCQLDPRNFKWNHDEDAITCDFKCDRDSRRWEVGIGKSETFGKCLQATEFDQITANI